jgi:hypothetical protein
MSERLINVVDRRCQWIGEWDTEPLVYDQLTESDIGRTVIYLDRPRRPSWGWAEAGTLSSFRDGTVWARFGHGDTAAACRPGDLRFGVKARDGDQAR